MKTFIVLCFSLCFVGVSKGQITPALSVASVSATTFAAESSGATLNVGSSSGEIRTGSSKTTNTLGSPSSTIINVVSPSSTKHTPLSYVTTRTVDVGSSIAASFTSATMHSASQSVKTPLDTTAPASTTGTGVEPTIASTVKPTITSSVNVDGCKTYTVLNEADRAQGHIVKYSNYRCDRNDLVPGWYRFQGAAGDRMADKCVPERHCGTYAPGWLNGTHPTVAEGVVTRRVCYHDHQYYWYWRSHCCFSSNSIRVRNCGAFFVYELQKTPYCHLRYCGNGSNAVDGCNNYTVLSEADRAQGHMVINGNNRCDRDDLVPGWYRFQGAAGVRMADKCVPKRHCGTYVPGWLNGIHPTVAEGVVTRRVCYHYHDYYWHHRSSCCYWSNNIRVRNCGAFYVYELQKMPYCNSRYCGNGSAVDGCNNYTVLSEADRSQGHIVINTSNYKSDWLDLVPGWYRFQGAAGDRMADKCVPERHCGTIAPGWLNGTHPSVAEGVVIRRVCFYRSISCCYRYNIIRIKNCGLYFVYELPRPYLSHARYCGNGSTAYTCPVLTVPSNGIKFGCPENATMYNDTVCQFSCNNGYIGAGSQARRCQLNGTWSGQEFTCQIAVTCPTLPLPTNSKLLGCSTTDMLYGTVCRFSCNEGFEAKGSTMRRCTGNGTWSGTDLVCSGITCCCQAQKESV